MNKKQPAKTTPKIPSTKKPMMVSIILDETGSMEARKEATISGYNEYVDELKRLKVPVTLTLTKFNSDQVKVVYADEKIKDVPHLDNKTYTPNALTPLYDAVGRTIRQIEKEKLKGKTVLVVVITDGEENASKEYKQQDIFTLISEKQKTDGWTFAFMGADQDAWKAGEKLGMMKANVMSFAGTNVRGAMQNLSRATMQYSTSSSRMTGHASTAFFAQTPREKKYRY